MGGTAHWKKACGWATPQACAGGGSALFDEFRFQAHGAEAFDLAVDVVIALHQADVLDLGAHLQGGGAALDLQVLDEGDGIPVLQDIPVGVPDDGLLLLRCIQRQGPLMGAFRADKPAVALVGVIRLAGGAGRQLAQNGILCAGTSAGSMLTGPGTRAVSGLRKGVLVEGLHKGAVAVEVTPV